MKRETILISSPLEAEHVERIRALDPARLEVLYEPDLLPATRYRNDHKGAPFTRSAEQRLRWQALVQMAGGRYDPATAAEALLTSVVVNYAAPKGLAVPTRAMLSARDLGLTATASGAVALWDVALDFAALSLMTLAWFAVTDRGLLRRIELPDGRVAAILIIAIALLGVAITIAAWRRPPSLSCAEATELPAMAGRTTKAIARAAAPINLENPECDINPPCDWSHPTAQMG